MNTQFLHPSHSRDASPGPLDDILGEQYPLPASQACCPARPVVRVVMPHTATRRHSVDLLLCGHHYRVSAQALAAAGATGSELREMAGGRPTALIPDLPESRIPVS